MYMSTYIDQYTYDYSLIAHGTKGIPSHLIPSHLIQLYFAVISSP